jgi:hypothetical protein
MSWPGVFVGGSLGGRVTSLKGWGLARSAHRTVLHLPAHALWAALLLEALTTLRALTEPD